MSAMAQVDHDDDELVLLIALLEQAAPADDRLQRARKRALAKLTAARRDPDNIALEILRRAKGDG